MDEKNLAAVNRNFNERKQKREALLAARREEVYRTMPRIREIDDAIFGGGMRMLSAVWDGKGSPEEVAAAFGRAVEKYAAEKKRLLIEAGFAPDYLDVPFTCAYCKDTGMRDGKLCGCYLSLLSEALYAESGMGQLLKKQTFDAFDLQVYSDVCPKDGKASPRQNMVSILNTCRAFVRDFSKHADSLFFYGAPGLGKTFLSSAIANALLKEGVSVLYQSAGQIVDLLSEIRFGKGENEAKGLLKEQLLKTDLLIIDDLGTEVINSMTDADIFSVVNSRIMAEKSTIISTNLSLRDIERIYSSRMTSRIMGHFKTLYFYGTDIRSMQ